MNPTPNDPETFPRLGARPTLLPGEPVGRTDDPYAPPYETYPDYQIRSLDFDPRWLRRRPPRLFASPDKVLYSLLASREVVVYAQSPSFSAFLLGNALWLIPLLVVGLVVNTMYITGNLVVYGILFIAVGVVWLFLAGRWIFRDRYIQYVLTTMRVMRVRGFIKRENAWIPLSKVTDVRYNSSLIGRTFGFAEIRIDSANEESGLKYMRNLDDPETFYEKLLLLVEQKQGYITLDQATPNGPPAAAAAAAAASASASAAASAAAAAVAAAAAAGDSTSGDDGTDD